MSKVPITSYFAYGSNMNPERVAERGLRTVHAVGATLEGYELRFNKVGRHHEGVGHANIEKVVGSSVEGVLYRFDHHDEILKMDPFERAPWNYGRDVVLVETGDEALWTWTYFANAAVKRDGLYPSQEYLDHLLAGEPFLTEPYFERLRQWPVTR
jgi:gamma-glutamylcyclotransferase (GGCT)/AIG2-like uncharacterized protein YtfP